MGYERKKNKKNPYLGWKQNVSGLTSITMNIDSVSQELPNFISCRCKTASGTKCTCKIVEVRFSVACLHCDLDIYEDEPEISINTKRMQCPRSNFAE